MQQSWFEPGKSGTDSGGGKLIFGQIHVSPGISIPSFLGLIFDTQLSGGHSGNKAGSG